MKWLLLLGLTLVVSVEWRDMDLLADEMEEGADTPVWGTENAAWKKSVGGKGGHPFSQDCSKKGGSIKTLFVRGGRFCGRVRARCNNGKLFKPSGGAAGLGAGKVKKINAPINEMVVRAGQFIDKVIFKYAGKTLGTCGASNGGRAYKCKARYNEVLCGIRGKSGAWMDRWQCGFCKVQQPSLCLARVVGDGACSSGDYKRLTNVKSAKSCLFKCKALKASVKFFEYNMFTKQCDCDNGSTCKLCCVTSSGKGFKSYAVGKQKHKLIYRNAVCGGADLGRLRVRRYSVGTCVRACRKRYGTSKISYVEYHRRSGTCDCQRGNKCPRFASRSTGGWNAWKVESMGCVSVMEVEFTEVENLDIDEETVTGLTPLHVAAGAGILVVSMFGVYKLFARRSDAEYASLLQA